MGNYKIISSREGKLQLARKMFMGKGTSDVITQWFRYETCRKTNLICPLLVHRGKQSPQERTKGLYSLPRGPKPIFSLYGGALSVTGSKLFFVKWKKHRR